MSIIKSLLLSLRNKKRSKGVAIIETALTLPIVCYLLFFMLELMKINLTQTAVETITQEATFITISDGARGGPALIAKIDAIIEKHRPSFIPQTVGDYDPIRYHFETYPSLEVMCANEPYGGTDVHYPVYENDEWARCHGSPTYEDSASLFLPAGDTHWHFYKFYFTTTGGYLKGSGFPSGHAFVLTVSCAYQFSSPFVKKLFAGGTNTRKCTKNAVGEQDATSEYEMADKYLLWGCGVGIVN